MRRGLRYWLRSACLLCMCFVIVFSTILLSTSIESKAAEVNADSWKNIEEYYGYANTVLLNGLGSGSAYFYTLPLEDSSTGDWIESVSEDAYIKEVHNYLYKFEIPLRFNFGDDERRTLDGELRYPLLLECSDYYDGNNVKYYLVGYECEMYDAEGKRINSNVNYSFDGYEAVDSREFGLTLNMRFDKRYVDKELYGTLRFYVGVQGSGLVNGYYPRMEVAVSHDSENKYFIDYCDVQYLVGNFENKELVTYQKPGSYVQNEDGSYSWQEGDSVTEYISTEEQNSNILSTLSNLPKAIGDMLIGIIVPSADDLNAWINDIMAFLIEHLGFLGTSIDFVMDLLEAFASDSDEMSFVFPSFSILGYKVWDKHEVSLSAILRSVQNEDFEAPFLDWMQYANSLIAVILVVRMAQDKFSKVFGGDS